jgi:putative hydrolase of the HAD superfamily
MFDLIALDADDTLWHSEILYATAQEKFQRLLSRYGPGRRIVEELLQTEMQNLRLYGYGIKGFALSMIETAVRLTDGRISGSEVQGIINLAREMMEAPVDLLDGAADVVATLSASHALMLITKGDLFDQERKIARSGLASHFAHIEIVGDKTIDVYRSLLARHQIDPQRFLMVGNSLRSDVMPVLALGGYAVHIPYQITWEHEAVDLPGETPGGYVELPHIRLLPEFLSQLYKRGVTHEESAG